MENKVFNMPSPISKYNLRSTGEEVEVIAFNQLEDGNRSEEDWVTYIDSEGNEHLREHLNIQLDFKLVDNNPFNKMLEYVNSTPKYPTERNKRIFDTAKSLAVTLHCSAEEAARKATELVDIIGIELN